MCYYVCSFQLHIYAFHDLPHALKRNIFICGFRHDVVSCDLWQVYIILGDVFKIILFCAGLQRDYNVPAVVTVSYDLRYTREFSWRPELVELV